MRTVAKDRVDVYVAQRLPSVPQRDENGYLTGDSVEQFDTIVKYRLSVHVISEDAEIQLYGADAVSMRKIVESPLLIDLGDISYLDPVWIGKIPAGYEEAPTEQDMEATPTPIPLPLDNNYFVCQNPYVTPRQIVIMLKSVTANG